MSKGFNNLKEDKILEKNENNISLIFTIPQDSPYFDGHFPGYPILPAVGQVDIVVNFASRHFGTGIAISQIKRTKFTKTITPNLTLLLKINIKDDVLSFKITAQDESDIYSSGFIHLTLSGEKK